MIFLCLGGKNEFWVWEAKMSFGSVGKDEDVACMETNMIFLCLGGKNEFLVWEAKMNFGFGR